MPISASLTNTDWRSLSHTVPGGGFVLSSRAKASRTSNTSASPRR